MRNIRIFNTMVTGTTAHALITKIKNPNKSFFHLKSFKRKYHQMNKIEQNRNQNYFKILHVKQVDDMCDIVIMNQDPRGGVV